MPAIPVVFYQEKDGDSQAVNWLKELKETDEKAFIKCWAAIKRLADHGHELRRPEADYLRDGIHELRIKRGSVNYRLLYFFHERTCSVVAHGCTKEDIVPPSDINRAITRKSNFIANPKAYTFTGEIENE